MSKKILMIVGEFTETLEVYCPMFTMRALGYTVDVCCPTKTKGSYVTTVVHDTTPECPTWTEKPGHCLMINCTFSEVNPKNYDGLWIPGGRAPEYLRMNPNVLECVKFFVSSGKPVAATCTGPQLLLATQCVPKRKMTCYPTMGPEVSLCGSEYIKCPNDECVVDENIVTGPTWMACPRTVTSFVNLLGTRMPPQH